MRSTGRATVMPVLACAALLLAAAAFAALRNQDRAVEAQRPAVLQRGAAPDGQEAEAEPATVRQEAPAVEVEPLALPELVPGAPSPRTRISVLRSWDARLPPSHERASCTLIVVDEHDAPVAGARVDVYGDARKPLQVSRGRAEDGYDIKHVEPVGPLASFTDEAGRCVVQGPRYGPVAVVRKDGVGCSGWVPIESSGSSLQFRELVVPLKPLARLRGVVRDARGAPVPGAVVEFPEPVFRKPGPAIFPSPVTTDAQGRFDVALDGGKRWIVASTATSRAKSRHIELTPGREKELALWLPGDWSVRGVVLASRRSGGAPVPKAWVRFWPDLGDPGSDGVAGWSDTFTGRADERGYFEIPLQRPMRGQLTVSSAGGVLREPVSVVVGVEEPQPAVTLQLAEPAFISGRIVDADGKPCAGAPVDADAKPVTSSPRVMRAAPDTGDLWDAAHAASADDGSFSLGPVHPDGVYTVSTWVGVKGERSKLVARSVRAGTSDLRLAADASRRPVAAIELDVRARSTGKALDEIRVERSSRDDDGLWADPSEVKLSHQRDLWTVPGLIAGARHALLVKADGLADAVIEDVLAAKAGDTLEVLLDDPGALEVHVVHDGTAAAYAYVEATHACAVAEWGRGPQWMTSARADERGTLRRSGLQPGSWAVTAWWNDRTAQQTIEVPAGATALVSVNLR